jgi:hypothetical protein
MLAVVRQRLDNRHPRLTIHWSRHFHAAEMLLAVKQFRRGFGSH